MVCLRILVLNAKIRISRIQKQTCLRFCSGGVSSAQPKIGDKRRTPAFRKLSFHQFFGSLPFFAPACVRRCRTFSCSLRQVPGTSRADRRPPRRDFPQSAPFLSECRAAQGAHSSQTTAAGRFPSPRQFRGHPVRKSVRRGGFSRSRRRSFRNAALCRAHIRPGRPLPDLLPLPGRVRGHPVRKSVRRLPGTVAGLRRILRRNRAGGRFPRAPKRIGTGYSSGSGHALLRRMNSTTSCSPSANFEKSSL